MKKIDQPFKKFEEIYKVEDYEIKTPQGWKSINNIFKTVPYEVWYIELENGDNLKGADTHILYTENHDEIFLKDIKVGQLIETDTGFHKVIKIENLQYEENMYDVEVDSEEHEFYSNNFVSHNTTTVGIYLLWYAYFNKDKTIAILAHKADMAKAILAEIKQAIEEMPEYIKPGIVEYNAYNIKFDNGSEIIAKATSPNALRGLSVHALLLDEFSHIAESIAGPFWDSNYPTLSATNGQCIIISTPNGTANLYYRLWKQALDKENTFIPLRVDWWEVPGRDEKWKKDTIKNMGEIKFNQEFGNSFIGSTTTLINGNYITQTLKSLPPELQPTEHIKIWKKPIHGHKYLLSIDTAGGVGSDNSVINIFDITNYPNGPAEQVATYKNNMITPPAFAELVFDTGEDWNNAYIIGELNGLSAEVFNRLFEKEYPNLYFDYEDESYGMYADKVSKPKAAMWFKEELETGKITIVDSDTIDEIGYFEEVKPGVYKAKEGRNNHDDLVMTCLWAAYFLKSSYFEDEHDTWGEHIDDDTDYPEDENQEEILQSFLDQDSEDNPDDWLHREEFGY